MSKLGSGHMRFGRILGIGFVSAALLVPGAASAAPCPSPSPPGEGGPAIPSKPFLLKRPMQIAEGNSSYARLISYPPAGVAYLTATFDYLAQDGSVLESRVLTARELGQISDSDSLNRTGSYPVLRFPVRWLPGHDGITLRFRVTIQPPGHPACELSVHRYVSFIPGLSPHASLHSYNLLSSDDPFELHWTVDLELGTRCERLGPRDLRVTIAHHGRVRVLEPRGCTGSYYGNWDWVQRGDVIPGLRAHSSFVALELYPVGARPRSRTYRVDLAWDGRRKARVWLRTTLGRRHPARRVRQGTEAFEDCVEGDPDLVRTDTRGRRYCMLPSWVDQTVQLFCRRPRRRDGRTVLNRAFGCAKPDLADADRRHSRHAHAPGRPAASRRMR